MAVVSTSIHKLFFAGLLVMGNLALFAQSPSFLFTPDTVSLQTTNANTITPFEVFKGNLAFEDYGKKQAILGRYFHDGGIAYFVPVVSLQEGLDYTVIYRERAYHFTVAESDTNVPFEITAIHPKTDSIPSNLLKFYLEFSEPVSPSKIYDHIALVESNGNVVDRALLPLETPLLSPDGKTLTLWIEPGRQKRDLGPNRRLGQVLREGAEYRLVIEKTLKNRKGRPLGKTFSKTYKVGNADRHRPDMKLWRLKLPEAATDDPLEIRFNEPMDFGSLQNNLHIATTDGRPVAGRFNISEMMVVFEPVDKWKKGVYVIKSKLFIEDIAGNTLERLFDREVHKKKRGFQTALTFKIP